MRAAALIVLLLIGGCANLPAVNGEQRLLDVCFSYVEALPRVAQHIRLDAVRPQDGRLLGADDLHAIEDADSVLDGFCPPPAGFTPNGSTVAAARAALLILLDQTGGQRP